MNVLVDSDSACHKFLYPKKNCYNWCRDIIRLEMVQLYSSLGGAHKLESTDMGLDALSFRLGADKDIVKGMG